MMVVASQAIRNSYTDARNVSSSEDEFKHSAGILGKLYRANGYVNPQKYDIPRNSTDRVKSNDRVTLCLDFISEKVSNQIRNQIRLRVKNYVKHFVIRGLMIIKNVSLVIAPFVLILLHLIKTA